MKEESSTDFNACLCLFIFTFLQLTPLHMQKIFEFELPLGVNVMITVGKS